MSKADETQRDMGVTEEPEVEDLEISKEEADAVSGGTVSSQTTTARPIGH